MTLWLKLGPPGRSLEAPLLVIWEEGLLPELGRRGAPLPATCGFWWQVRFPMRPKALRVAGSRRVLPGVDPVMHRQRGPVAEGLAALRALTGLLAGVDPAVLDWGRLAAHAALEGPLVAVDGRVLEQEHLPEAAPALAQRCGFSPVWIHSGGEGRLLAEGLVALLAREGPLPGVRAPLDGQVGLWL